MRNTDKAPKYKTLILEKALVLFLDKGYIKTTTKQIAHAAGINEGLLYYYYNKKEDIFCDLYVGFLRGLAGYINFHSDPDDSSWTRLTLMNLMFYKIWTEDARLFRLLLDTFSNHKLQQIYIELSMAFCVPMIQETKNNLSQRQMRIAFTIFIGAATQLIYNIAEKKLDMDIEEFSVITETILFEMLGLKELEIDRIISNALLKIVAYDIKTAIDFLKEYHPWHVLH